MLLSICRTCIQVQFDVSAPRTAPHLDDLFLHRERRELESGAPAALGEGAFAGTRLVRRFRPMDEHERGGRGLNRWRRKPSASEIDDRKFRKSRFRKDPLSTGASNIITWPRDDFAANEVQHLDLLVPRSSSRVELLLQLRPRVPAAPFSTGLALSSVDGLRRQGTQGRR